MAFTDRVVLVTGATGDIGAAYTEAFTSAGADVIAADLPALTEQGTQVARRASSRGPGRAVFAPCDITSEADATAAVALAVERFGGLDVLVNNAAIYKSLGVKRSITELTPLDWDTVLRVNVRGTWQMIAAAVPALRARGGGRIVNIASTVARNAPVGFAHYVASKAAVEGLTRAAARELGPDRIGVNTVAPGLVDDDASRALNDPDYLAAVSRTRPLARAMVPEDLIGAVLWLAGESSSFVTGQTVVVDGGGVFV